MLFSLLFKFKYLFCCSPGQIEKFVKNLCFWVGNFMCQMFRICRVYQLTLHLQLVHIKLPKSNSPLQEGHFISVHSLPFKIFALVWHHHKKLRQNTRPPQIYVLPVFSMTLFSVVLFLFQKDKPLTTGINLFSTQHDSWQSSCYPCTSWRFSCDLANQLSFPCSLCAYS